MGRRKRFIGTVRRRFAPIAFWLNTDCSREKNAKQRILPASARYFEELVCRYPLFLGRGNIGVFSAKNDDVTDRLFVAAEPVHSVWHLGVDERSG